MKKICLFIGLILLTICSFGQNQFTSVEVNFRTSPEVKRNKICKIPRGAVVTIVQVYSGPGNWMQISYNGQTGYVSRDYLQNVAPNPRSYNHRNDNHRDNSYNRDKHNKKPKGHNKGNSKRH